MNICEHEQPEKIHLAALKRKPQNLSNLFAVVSRGTSSEAFMNDLFKVLFLLIWDHHMPCLVCKWWIQECRKLFWEQCKPIFEATGLHKCDEGHGPPMLWENCNTPSTKDLPSLWKIPCLIPCHFGSSVIDKVLICFKCNIFHYA